MATGNKKNLLHTLEFLENISNEFYLKQKELFKILHKEISANEEEISIKDEKIRLLSDSYAENSELVQNLYKQIEDKNIELAKKDEEIGLLLNSGKETISLEVEQIPDNPNAGQKTLDNSPPKRRWKRSFDMANSNSQSQTPLPKTENNIVDHQDQPLALISKKTPEDYSQNNFSEYNSGNHDTDHQNKSNQIGLNPIHSDQIGINEANNRFSHLLPRDFSPESALMLLNQNNTISTSLPVSSETDIMGSYTCPECGKIFKHPGSLQHHRHIHRGTHRCFSCGKAFSRRWDLERHLNKSKYGCPAVTRFKIGSTGSNVLVTSGGTSSTEVSNGENISTN